MPISEVTFDEGYLLFTDSDGVATKVLPIEEVKRLVIIADPDEGTPVPPGVDDQQGQYQPYRLSPSSVSRLRRRSFWRVCSLTTPSTSPRRTSNGYHTTQTLAHALSDYGR